MTLTSADCPEEILGKKHQYDLTILKSAGILDDFYLAGGTGVALMLKHRQSHDLDFFSGKNFKPDLLASRISELGHFELEKKEEGTLTGLFNNTRLSLFYYPYPLLRAMQIICGISVANIIDIACMKIDAIASRGSKKDFIDLYMIARQGNFSLEDLFDFFEKKYQKLSYNLIHIKKGLVYFDDAEKDPEPIMLQPMDWDKIKDFFKNIKRL